REQGEPFTALFIQGFSGDGGPYGHYRDEKEDTYPWVKERGHELYLEVAELAGHATQIAAESMQLAESTAVLPTKNGYFKPSIEATLHGLRIGDLAILSVPCEVFNGYVDRIRPLSAAKITLFAGVSNGYFGYLP